MTAKAERLRQIAEIQIAQQARIGVRRLEVQLAGERRTLDKLSLPVGAITGETHGHGEPFKTPGCGWCANVRHWRAAVSRTEAAIEIARALERRLDQLAPTVRSGAAFEEVVLETIGAVPRYVVRESWKRAKEGRAHGG